MELAVLRDFWYDGSDERSRHKASLPQSGNKDRALLIALILILASDGGDEMLIMALLYILS